MAAELAPRKVSAGNLPLRTGRRHVAMARITPTNDTAFSTNALPMPAAAIGRPERPGPTARAKLNSMPLRASARESILRDKLRENWVPSGGFDGVAKRERQGREEEPRRHDSSNCGGGQDYHDCKHPCFRAEDQPAAVTVLPMEPAERAKRKNGSAEAVWINSM
jgi:hypothetical protein